MKHVSASVLERAAELYRSPILSNRGERAQLVTDDDLKAKLRVRFEAAGCDKTALARKLGVTSHQLTLVLRGRGTITERIAQRLGYRKVIRFEKVE